MESYPGEILVGVFPLVFCVDATLTSHKAAAAAAASANHGGTNDDNNNSNSRDGDDDFPASSGRSQFDRFLDAMAASLSDEPEGGLRLFGNNDAKEFMTPNPRRRNIDLFRGDDDMDSDQEDYMILGTGGDALPSSGYTASNPSGGVDASAPARAFSPNLSFPRLGRDSSFGGSLVSSRSRGSPSRESSGGVDTSFAKVLQQGQGFFQRARIVSISSRHGFPPSKDPTGEDNRIKDYFLGKTLQTSKILSATKRRPIDGILPSGWLEKHAAALPSVIIVVVQVSSHQHQHEQDELLRNTMDNLQMSLAPKRQCTIRIIGLVQEGISSIMAEQWSQSMDGKFEGNPTLTLLNVSDLKQDAGPSATLQMLHKTVHDASLNYYMAQARQTKRKLFELGQSRNTPLLLPLCIRYCFKVAMFYEFQWNPEKSLKYMVEAYRNLEIYFRYLLEQKEIGATQMNKSAEGEDSGPKVKVSNQRGNMTNDGDAEGVELSLPSKEDDMMNLLLNPAAIPEDMIHQCRVLADWLNFKILQSGLTSHTQGGQLAASAQWQRHVQTFCNPRRSFFCSPDHSYVDWSFLAHQRLVASQLLERHPPRALGELGQEYDEALLRCSPWRAYQAAAEAILRLAVEVKKAAATAQPVVSIVDEMRSRYVGGLDKDGFQPKLQEELSINHQERALDCIRRAISLLRREAEKSQSDNPVRVNPWSRSEARLQYLAGGILLGLGKQGEAAGHLEKAATAATGWNDLQLIIRRMLIKCYEGAISEESQAANPETYASTLLDSYFNANMSNSALRQALEKFSVVMGGRTIQWHRECIDEADESLPFSFAMTFPSATHAVAGDRVRVSVLIKSNLKYASHLNSVTLHTFAGKIQIPSTDLLSAKNANEGTEGGIIIQANDEILVSTVIELPRDLNSIAVDESGNGGEKEGVAGKGSFAKSAKPRTGGITAAGGARMISEEKFRENERREGNSQWSTKCLGGKPLRCDGMCLVFYPVYSTAIGDGKNTIIELTIEKKQVVTEANIKRTPFEEENYISSAWMRPRYLPLNRGPRCLRVLPPTAELIVTNLTEPCTNGKVLEGTVNRLVLRLVAGPNENCTNLEMRASCSSLLVSGEGKTTKIAFESGADDVIPIVDPTSENVRTPILVKQDDERYEAQMTEYGFKVPAGWRLADNNGLGGGENFVPVVSTLNSGDATYIAIDIYRPSPRVTRINGVVQVGDDEQDLTLEHSTCQTSIEVTVQYLQSRPIQEQKLLTTKRRGKRQHSNEQHGVSEENKPELVSLTRKIAVVWSAPISATFTPGVKETHPSGNRHPSNAIPDPIIGSPLNLSSEKEMVLVDGERVATRCSLEAGASADGLMANIEEIRFKNDESESSPCTFKLLSGKDEAGLLYIADSHDPSRKLENGSKFSFAWMSQVNMKSNYLKGSVSASLGMIEVVWAPTPMTLPEEVQTCSPLISISEHGPLILRQSSTCNLMGPPCYIENAPFETIVEALPDVIHVATPFDITYHIKNKTSRDQTLKVSLQNSAQGLEDPIGSFLVAGPANVVVSLGPFEAHTLSYTTVPMRTGEISMPKISVSSDRYHTYLIQDPKGRNRTIFVMP